MTSKLSEDKKYQIQILISILILILTPLLSGLVVYYQLEKQHFIWDIQRKIIHEETILKEKISRLDKTGRIITGLIQKEKMARTIINNLVKLHAYHNEDKIDKTLGKTLDNIFAFTLNIAKEYEELEVELLSIVRVNKFYFNIKVTEKGNKLIANLYLLKSSSMPLDKLRLLKQEIPKLGNDTDKLISDILHELDKPEEIDTFVEIAKELLAEMSKEIHLENKS
jgi:hypothetical protein